jgi:quercetin dioxygenase-like cupin family protein
MPSVSIRTSTPRLLAAMLALVSLSVAPHQAAAQSPSKPPSPGIAVPYGDVRFRSLSPGVPDGPEIAVLRGDPATGPSTMLMKMRKAAGRLHVHTVDYELVVIEGTMKHWRAAEDEASARPLGPGSYWFQPGGAAHADSCVTDVCVMYITWAGPRDGRLADARP